MLKLRSKTHWRLRKLRIFAMLDMYKMFGER